jgi:hypothetical protein
MASRQSDSASKVLGSWRITGMELWSRDMLDLVVPAHLTFEHDLLGSFQFIAVRGWIDYRVASTPDGTRVDFSWEGFDDRDPSCGRGWAVLKGATLEGRFYFHNGDDSAFVAERIPLHRGKAKRARHGV